MVWVDVEEQNPPRNNKYENLSKDIKIKLFSGEIVNGFYNYKNDEYYIQRPERSGYRKIDYMKVKAWAI